MPRTPGSYSSSRPVRDVRQKAWNAMIVHKTFTTAQIQAVAGIGQRNLNTYLRALERVGIVRIQRPRQSGKTLGHAVWRLVRHLGPRHPIVRRDGSGVYDPNEDCFHPFQEEDSTDAGRVVNSAS